MTFIMLENPSPRRSSHATASTRLRSTSLVDLENVQKARAGEGIQAPPTRNRTE